MRPLLALCALLALAGCGIIDDFPTTDGGGPVCYSDADCVPNDCCGQGTGAVHFSLAPDCTGVVCTGTCPLEQVNCGCGLPVCRLSQCTVAVSTDPQCP